MPLKFNTISSNNFELDANLISKSWSIEMGVYEIEIDANNMIKKINPLFNVKDVNKAQERIEELYRSLYYAANGYTDCEIPIKEFNRLMACFRYNGISATDFDFR